MAIKIFVNGAQGKMGQAVIAAIAADTECELVGQGDHDTDLKTALRQTNPQVVVDFTIPAAVYQNAKTIIQAGIHPVIGTTGLTLDQIQELQHFAAEKKLGGIIAPNFSLGIILMMHCAQIVARYFPDVAIIESHHPHKLDAPAGTSKKTAEMIAAVRPKPTVTVSDENASLGLHYHGIPIHALRMPGVVANQEVIFGGPAETLTIRHDTLNRSAYMPGVLLACKRVPELTELVYGLEYLLRL